MDLLYHLLMIDEYGVWWIDNWQENAEILRETCPSATLSGTVLILNPGSMVGSQELNA
jgi:hypothetical protein